ncbi:MAG: Gfo/Idh/MocA family protein [Terriglobia bacterium]
MVRLGIAGIGYMGRLHYEASLRNTNAHVTAVSTSRPEEARRFLPAEVRIYPSYKELLNSGIDAVVIAVPTFLHEQYVAEAAECHRHILCEKPFALDQAASRRMLDAAGRAGVTLMIGQVLRFWPHYARIKELVAGGTLGAIRAVDAYRLASYPSWSRWFRDPRQSGGARLDVQVHDVDFIYWLMGSPKQVYAAGLKSSDGGWDHVQTTFRYPGAVANAEASFLMPAGWPFSCGIRVAGESGCLEYGFRVAGNIAERGETATRLLMYTPNAPACALTVDDEDMYAAQLRYFAECVERGQEPARCLPAESCEVMGLMDLCLESLERGQTVSV